MLITDGCSDYIELHLNMVTLFADYHCPSEVETEGVWMYDHASVRLLRLDSQPVSGSSMFSATSIVRNDLLLYFGGLPADSLTLNETSVDWNGFLYTNGPAHRARKVLIL